jgi:transposase
VTIVAEAGDLRRFPTARQFMAYVGLVPSEHSSGDSRHRGHITKTGNRDRPESVPLRPSGAQTPMYDPAECQREPSQTSQPAPF